MTHRDGFPRFSARSAWRGDAAHRKARATPSESLGSRLYGSLSALLGISQPIQINRQSLAARATPPII
jgi:hypothetical protein